MEELSRVFSLISEQQYMHGLTGGILLSFAVILLIAVVSYIVYKVAIVSLKVLSFGAVIYFVLLFVAPNEMSAEINEPNEKVENSSFQQFKAHLNVLILQSKPLLNRVLDIKPSTVS